MRPKDSLDFTKPAAQALFFGDETSVAALRTLYQQDATARAVLEVDAPSQVQIILQRLAIENVSLIQKTQDASYLDEVVSKLSGGVLALQEPQ